MRSSVSGDEKMISAGTVIRRNPRVVSRNLADETGALLLHLDTTAYHGLDEIGEMVWSSLEQPIAFESLILALRARLEDPPPNLEDDIVEFLRDLKARDLLLFDDQP
jgi:Coenzyme PQQ synthesis protein D (PqqD)